MSRSLAGQSAIVTGAAGGINLEFARLLLQGGVNVLIADLTTRPESEELLSQYQDKPKAIFLQTDVTSWQQLTAMFKKAESEFGSVDIVCPGAGIFEPAFSNFWYPPGSAESKDDPFGGRYKTMDVNLTHPIRVTQLAISHFMASTPPPSPTNPKVIVHVTSIACQIAYLGFPMYHASKHGLAGFIRSLGSLEKELNIRVAGVAPGAVKTPLWTEDAEKLKLVTVDGKVSEDWITPQEVAERMLAIVTGEEMISDDGSKVRAAGGLVLEVCAGNAREIPMFDNPGPDRSKVATAGNIAYAAEDAVSRVKTEGWGQVST